MDDKLKNVILNYKSLPNKELEFGLGLISEDFEDTKKLLVKLTHHLDSLEKNHNNIYTNINNNTLEYKKKEFSDMVLKSFQPICELFPIQTQPKTQADKKAWIDCIDKLERLDGYSPRKVYYIAQKVRGDDFWRNNFLTILKLRKKNKDGLKYINLFEAKFGKNLKQTNI